LQGKQVLKIGIHLLAPSNLLPSEWGEDIRGAEIVILKGIFTAQPSFDQASQYTRWIDSCQRNWASDKIGNLLETALLMECKAMRAVVQRVDHAAVEVAGHEIARIGRGLLALVGFHRHDSREDLQWMAKKLAELRVFSDEEGKLNLSLLDVGGELLLVSQFTVYGDCRKGRRPSYTNAAPPAEAESLYSQFLEMAQSWIPGTQSGRFQAMMNVSLLNAGPVTLILDSRKNV
jgi:D-tyrosyl-tRNA(Tyr) deacylase